MRLFTKRYTSNRFDKSRYIRNENGVLQKISGQVNKECRNRLISEIRFLTSNNDFLEWFILFENQKKEKIFFDENKLDSFSLAELGYRFTDYFKFDEFSMISKTERTGERAFELFEDFKLFDLIEVIILFSKNTKRSEIIERFNSIFIEENEPYIIQDNFVVSKREEDIRTVLPILKDVELKNKFELFYLFFDKNEYLNASKISSDIVNIIFSDYLKDSKPKKIKEILSNLSKKITGVGRSDSLVTKKDLLYHIFDNLLKNVKDLTNSIYDIRHTEISTIKPKNQNIYKLVSLYNISICELAITSSKNEFIIGEDWEKIKSDYIKKYNIDSRIRLVIKKPEPVIFGDEDINPDDIPF